MREEIRHQLVADVVAGRQKQPVRMVLGKGVDVQDVGAFCSWIRVATTVARSFQETTSRFSFTSGWASSKACTKFFPLPIPSAAPRNHSRCWAHIPQMTSRDRFGQGGTAGKGEHQDAQNSATVFFMGIPPSFSPGFGDSIQETPGFVKGFCKNRCICSSHSP